MAIWLPKLTRNVHDIYGFGYACAYNNSGPQMLTASGRKRGLIHSTEGGNLPDYRGGRDNPNATLDPWLKKGYQHCPLDVAARATMANNHQFVQVEIIGLCDLAAAKKYNLEHKYLENMGQDELDFIAEYLEMIGNALDIPATSGATFKTYPASIQRNAGIRFSQTRLENYTGWLGHQHAPSPDGHGDPGAWPQSRGLFALMEAKANGGKAPAVKAPTTGRFPIKTDGIVGAGTQAALMQLLRASKYEYAVGYVNMKLREAGYTGRNGKPLAKSSWGIYQNQNHKTAASDTCYALLCSLGFLGNDGTFDYPTSAGAKAWQVSLNAGKVIGDKR